MRDSFRHGRSMGVVVTGALVANMLGIGYVALRWRHSILTATAPGSIAGALREYAIAVGVVIVVYEALTWGLTVLPLRRRVDAAHEPSRRQAGAVVIGSFLAASLWAMALAAALGADLENVAQAVLRWGRWGFAVGAPAGVVVWWLAHRRNVAFLRHGGHRHDGNPTPPIVRGT